MSERVEPEEMIAWIDRRIASAGNWLNTFSDGPKKRPDIEIQTKQYDIARFNEIRIAYVKAWERKKAAEENDHDHGERVQGTLSKAKAEQVPQQAC